MRRSISAALIAGSLTFVGFAPASATPAPPTFSDLSTATPGHVTGTVTTDQPYVFIRMANDTQTSMVTVAPDGTGTFDLATWGFGSSSGTTFVQAAACPTTTYDASCSPTVTSDAFTPSDVTPQVTWFTDGTIGPGQDDPSITVSDTGGGDLRAIFVSDGDRSDVLLDHNGTTVLPVTDGVGFVRITRCRSGSTFVCNDLGFAAPLEQSLEVRRTASAAWTSGGIATKAAPNPVFDVSTSRPDGAYTLTWQLENVADPGIAVVSSATPETGSLSNGVTSGITIDTTGVPDGDYQLVGTLTIDEPDWGTYTDVPLPDASVTVDKTGPSVSSMTAAPATIYPRIGTTRYPGTTHVTVAGSLEYADTAVVRNAAGAPVAHPELQFTDESHADLTWSGRTDAGVVVPSGTYTVIVLDAAGNESAKVAHVTVDARQLVTKTLTKTLTATGSKVLAMPGACSSVTSPSTHGWTGSISLLSNSKCHRSADASTVVTAHAINLPAATSYLTAQVKVYAGAARGAAGSRAQLFYLKGGSGDITAPAVLGATVGTHAGPRLAANNLVLKDGAHVALLWYVATARGNRYDVKNFTVTVRYQVLR